MAATATYRSAPRRTAAARANPMPSSRYATVRLRGPRSATGWTVYRPFAAATSPSASSKHTNPAAVVTSKSDVLQDAADNKAYEHEAPDDDDSTDECAPRFGVGPVPHLRPAEPSLRREQLLGYTLIEEQHEHAEEQEGNERERFHQTEASGGYAAAAALAALSNCSERSALATVEACQALPPCAVGTPSSFRLSAIARSDRPSDRS